MSFAIVMMRESRHTVFKSVAWAVNLSTDNIHTACGVELQKLTKRKMQIGLLQERNNTSYLWRLHIQNFGNSSLHDEEVWVVHIELHRPKKILNPHVVGITAIDEVLVSATNDNLGDAY